MHSKLINFSLRILLQRMKFNIYLHNTITHLLLTALLGVILPGSILCGEAEGQEIFLKNISLILDHLLRDYDKSQHPNLAAGRPTTIRTNILIRSMGPISEHDMDFSVDCYYRQYWRDPRLSFRGPVESLSLNIKMLEKLWRPDTYFHNGKNSYLHTITVPNKLLRITQAGDVLYSMRLTIKAKCSMCLKSYPLDTQSCPLTIGSYAYTSKHILYSWDNSLQSVSFVPGLSLSQFDLISSPYQNFSIQRKEGDFSVLQVNFNLVRHAGYFLIQVYIPACLIVVLSFVSFWINREATSDRIGLGITAVLTLSTISLDSRTDLPKVHYATALDWFLFMSFGYCMATLLEFAAVHIGSGESGETVKEDENDAAQDTFREWTSSGGSHFARNAVGSTLEYSNDGHFGWKNAIEIFDTPSKSTISKETQTEKRSSCFRQFLKCVVHDQAFRKQRQQTASLDSSTNSVSRIDTISRILFPLSFLLLNILYWVMYAHLHHSCDVYNQKMGIQQ